MPDKATLLIVDDDEDVLLALKTKLERTGRFDVSTESDAHQALRRVRAQKPDLIVCDIDMPEMDGGELAATLRDDHATATLPVVFLSSLVSPQDTAEGTVSGKWPMMSKRSPVEQLVKTIDELLATRRR